MAKSKEPLICEANTAHRTPALYQRDTDGLFVCPPCVPESTWKNYPGAKGNAVQVHERFIRRSEQARQNFGKEVANGNA